MLAVIFIDRLHFTAKFFVTSISDNFHFISDFKFASVIALSHKFFPHNLLFALRKSLLDNLASLFYFTPLTNI